MPKLLGSFKTRTASSGGAVSSGDLLVVKALMACAAEANAPKMKEIEGDARAANSLAEATQSVAAEPLTLTISKGGVMAAAQKRAAHLRKVAVAMGGYGKVIRDGDTLTLALVDPKATDASVKVFEKRLASTVVDEAMQAGAEKMAKNPEAIDKLLGLK